MRFVCYIDTSGCGLAVTPGTGAKMPKSPEKTFNATPKKRGRKKKFGRRVSQGKELKPVPDKTTSNDLESITAQTATNLKAFRSLFGSQKEVT